jgi:hypothetical protein
MGFALARNIARAGIAVRLLAVVAAGAETIALAEGLGVDPQPPR